MVEFVWRLDVEESEGLEDLVIGDKLVVWKEGFVDSESSRLPPERSLEKFVMLSFPFVLPLRSVDWLCAENWGMGLGGLGGVGDLCWFCCRLLYWEC